MLNTTSTYIFLDVIALIIKKKEMNFALCLLKYQAIMRMTEKVSSMLSRWMWVASLTTPSPEQNLRYSPNGRLGGPQRLSVRLKDGENFLLLLGIEPRFLDRPDPNNVR
jgi:hypothetical protein